VTYVLWLNGASYGQSAKVTIDSLGLQEVVLVYEESIDTEMNDLD